MNAPRSERHHHDHRHEVRASTSPAACPSQAGTEWACSVERRPEFSSFSELSFTASPLLWSASRHPNCCARGHRNIARCAASAQPLGRIAIAVEPSTTVASFAAVSSLEVCPTPALRLGCCEDLSRLTGRCRTNLNFSRLHCHCKADLRPPLRETGQLRRFPSGGVLTLAGFIKPRQASVERR